MNKHRNAEMPDSENPEWSDADFKRAVTLDDLPEPLQKSLRGRPKAMETKERITIRLSAEVLEAFRGTGAGWQTRIDAVLKDWVIAHKGSGGAKA
ncbi:hypothetical protein B8X02_05235 [Stenotrophomonas rhizophila]|jgi:uncharacterized protein (DUF4415 family)|uniref:BrnA antitoxin family protein n=2 Tax=Lysobacteraceae TaxID=32033 RepID=UPI000BA5EF2D|nr:BrnA antitoxin family protein [Stenotrophomonas rhizophila]MDQ1061321.1 uncharacterized protein (DUF4415 family) [Stenotrophomonas sp. SORGH_AS_0282]MDQ1190330.1 uncharacterized protein (DUF4415 family) [Stenotrophomonas sp. SORGH_AS_0282]PAK93356.1 hypothetical protein B8X02_05235 [Stenotrophomonas rhizophila]UQY87226.1 BrnA antitoxin family protein [Stenotrophomonas rhizophila]